MRAVRADVRTGRRAVVGVAALLAMTGCTDGSGPEPGSDPGEGSGSPSVATDDPTEDGGEPEGDATSTDEAQVDESRPSEPAEAGSDSAPPLSTDASTEDRTQEPGAGLLAVAEVRVGSHDGFDRIVFDLDGDAEAGWGTFYVDEPRAQGSGAPIELEGDAALEVQIRGVTLPPDLPDDITAYDGPETIAGPPGGVVLEVVEDTIFEGYHSFFVGVDHERPYRIEQLDDPQRVVIDVLHTDS